MRILNDKDLHAALDAVSAAYDPRNYEPALPPDYTEQLDRLGHSSDAANAELRAVNARLEELRSQLNVSNAALSEAEKEIKALNVTVEELRRELDKERKRAEKSENSTQRLSVFAAILSAAVSVSLSVLIAVLN